MLTDTATGEEVRAAIDDACAIAAIPAPTGAEHARAEAVAERLAASGLSPERDAVGNVLARIGTGAGPIVVAAHLDTVFDLDHISVERGDDELRGPGIADNSLGLAGLLFLARRLADRAGDHHRPLVLAATVGEEGFGNLRGAGSIVESENPSEFIALEGGEADEIVLRGVGSKRFRLSVRTNGGHSWQDRGKPSAIHELLRLLGTLLADSGTASANVGTFQGGSGINVVASEAQATLEFRDVDPSLLGMAAQRLDAAVAQQTREGVTIEALLLGERPAGGVSADHQLVQDALRARASAGLDAPRLASSSTDANAALGVGIPAITVGLGLSRGAHTLDERVDISQLDRTLTALSRLVHHRTAHPKRFPPRSPTQGVDPHLSVTIDKSTTG